MLFLTALACTNQYNGLSGEDVWHETVIEHFETTEESTNQILFVIDSSGSMEDNWSNVDNQIVNLALALDGVDDWTAQIITTDLSTNAAFLDEPKETGIDLIGQYYQRRGAYSTKESGLDASLAWVTQHPLDGPVTFIFISDEDDAGSTTPTNWETAVSTLIDDQIFVISIVTLENPGLGESIGEDYIAVADTTVEIRDQISWSPLAQNISHFEEQLQWFYLETEPIPSSIQVWVNVDPINYWDYLENDNAVYLRRSVEPYSILTVAYYEKTDD